MKILQVCLKPPYPKVDGGCVAMAAMTESMLLANHEVQVLCMSTHKHPFNKARIPADILYRTEMKAVEMDTRIKPLDAFLNLFSSRSYNIERFYSNTFENRLKEIVKNNAFDIIHLESLFCTPYIDMIRAHSTGKIVVRTHNVEFKIWEQLATQESNPIRKWYLKLLAQRLRKYELSVLKIADGLVHITNDDASFFLNAGISTPYKAIPIGVKIDSIPVKPLPTNGLYLYHLGAMDWEPNVEGINWFLDQVWPKIAGISPDVKCSLAGRKMPSSLLSRSNGNLSIEGEVTSVEEFISDKNVAIVPLLSGSGMRVKIIEAMAFGKVVITTTLGAAGIPFSNGTDILIADTPEQFSEQVRFLEENPEMVSLIGAAARKLAEQEFSMSKLGSKLTYFYGKL